MVAKLIKRLSPKKLKVKEVRLKILNELRAEGRLVKKELEKTTATWKGAKPTFDFAIGLRKNDAIVLVAPVGNVEGIRKWIWLDGGTKPHPIKAKNVPNLIFRDGRGFTPKTKVKVFASGPGANTGQWVKKKEVRHPGIDAREWSKEIVKRRQKKFAARLSKSARI